LVVIDQWWEAVDHGMIDRQTDKQTGMTIRLTLCDANVTQQMV